MLNLVKDQLHCQVTLMPPVGNWCTCISICYQTVCLNLSLW